MRMRDRGLKGRFNAWPKGRRGKLSPRILRTIGRRLKGSPQRYGFETGSWQLSMIIEMIRRDFGILAKTRTLRRWLHKMGFSWRKSRYVPYKSAPEEKQEEFKKMAGERAAQMRSSGLEVLVEDEAAVQMSQNQSCGWRPVGGREQVGASYSKKSIRIFGAMSQGELRIKIVDSTSSETFLEFLDDIRRVHPGFYMVLDNASYRKPDAVIEGIKSTKGDIHLEFLPPYTPQLNPIETVWRDLKRRLAGRFFGSIDELKAAVTAILEREMGNRLKGYLGA